MFKAKIFLCGMSLLGLLNVHAADPLVPEATTYQIRNVKYGELLRPRDANSAEGTPIVLYPAQPWKCMTWQLKPDGDGSNPTSTFRVKNFFTSKTFHAVPNADTNTLQHSVTQLRFPKDGTPVPTWRFVHQDDGSYEIVDTKSGNAVTAVKENEASEAHIVTAPWVNQDNQKWRLEKIDTKDLTM